MADKKISQLTGATTPLAGTEVLPIVQGGNTVKVSAADVTAGRAVSAASVAVTGSSAPANGVYLPAANTVGIATNNANEFRVDSSGRLLLGTTSILNYGGDATLARSQTVVRDASTNTVLPVAAFVRRATGTPAAGIGAEINLVTENAYSDVSNYASVGCVATDLGNITGDLSISTRLNNTMTEQVRVTSAGNVKMVNAGKGIDFSANTGAAGMTSELLNWYEEGTWTPTLTINTPGDLAITYSSQVGYYTRIGRLVSISFDLQTSAFTHSTATGVWRLAGLPFLATSNIAYRGGTLAGFQGITKASYTQFGLQTATGVAQLLFVAGGSGQAWDYLNPADLPSGGSLILQGFAQFIL